MQEPLNKDFVNQVIPQPPTIPKNVVWLAERHVDYEPGNIIGIYSTEEKGWTAVESFKQINGNDNFGCAFTVSWFELDKDYNLRG